MMTPEQRIARVRHSLMLTRDLRAGGVPEHTVRRACDRGDWVRVCRGVYVETATWQHWYPDEQHLARAIAVHALSRSSSPLFSHHTAAMIHGLPGFEMRTEPVHTTVQHGRSHGRSAARFNHVADDAEYETVVIGGLRCTTLPRTLLDIAIAARAEQAVVMLDAGVRQLAEGRAESTFDTWQIAIVHGLERGAGRRPGIRRARQLLAFADPRADSPAESLSRLQLTRMGFRIESQVAVQGPQNKTYVLDFEFLGQGVFGEVDGVVKYRDLNMTQGRHAAEVVAAEKRREDWIRGVTGKRVVRWGFDDARDFSRFRSLLREFGVVPLEQRG